MNTDIVCSEQGDLLVFDAKKCGITFPEVAYVSQWKSANPLVCIPRPLGRNAVTQVLDEVLKLRVQHGIE